MLVCPMLPCHAPIPGPPVHEFVDQVLRTTNHALLTFQKHFGSHGVLNREAGGNCWGLTYRTIKQQPKLYLVPGYGNKKSIAKYGIWKELGFTCTSIGIRDLPLKTLKLLKHSKLLKSSLSSLLGKWQRWTVQHVKCCDLRIIHHNPLQGGPLHRF